jgi:hypothetical protein
MKTVKYIKFIFILLITVSCSTNKSVVGLYGKCGKGYFTCSQIELKPDNTFEYFIFHDVGGGNVIKGTWKKISNDTIVINTYKQPEIPKTTYVGKINPNLIGKVKIRISDKKGALGFTDVFINDREQLKVANNNGIAEFEVESIKNIEYRFISHQEKIEIENPNYNEIDILIKDLDLNAVPEFITNEKIVFKRNKIIMDTTFVYKKTNLKNKQWK